MELKSSLQEDESGQPAVPQKRVRFLHPNDAKKKREAQSKSKEKQMIIRSRHGPPHHLLPLSPYDPSISSLDPFKTLDQPSSLDIDIVLHHWTTTFRNTRIPLSPRPVWLHTSICNPTLLAVTVASSTSHILLLRGSTKLSPKFISQKLEAIRLINEELKIPDAIPSDTIIMAVTAMVLIECLAGTPASCSIHKRGLELLIQKRGGIRNLGFDGITQKTVSWADTCCAIMLRSKPHFHPILTASDGETTWSKPLATPPIKNLHTRLHNLTGSPNLSAAIIHIWARLHQLSSFLFQIPISETWKFDQYLLSDKLDAIERQTISVLHSDAMGESLNPAILSGFLNAAFIYVYQILREVPRGSAVCSVVAGRIHSGLELVDLRPLVATCPDILLWTLMVGRSGAPTKGPTQSWFTEVLEESSSDIKVKVPNTVEGMGYFEIAQSVVRQKS